MRELCGVHAATVLDVRDPKRLGRVRVRLNAREVAGLERRWARLATLMAGAGRGTWFVPDVGDEVLVAFEAGDARRPYVVGALWNPSARPPERMDANGANARRAIRTGAGALVAIDDAARTVEVTDPNGNSIVLAPSGISIKAATRVEISASTIELAAGMVAVNAGMARFSGTVQCDTVIANNVVGSSYTPGAGNIQ